uniref:KRAB domain-containing protein n=1 Tax=Phocoena sinus TaxID=42100 RepID=A0A8C9BPZ1_PHOSS
MGDTVSMAFQDLAVRFSEDEWRLLGEGQRALYLDVMRENYETLASLGEGQAGAGWRVDGRSNRERATGAQLPVVPSVLLLAVP